MAVSITGMDEPFIKPLLNDLEELGISTYLGTNEFNKLMVRNKLHNAWDQFQKDARNMRTIFTLDFDMTGMDNEKALNILLNRCYNQGTDLFYQVTTLIIEGFMSYKKNPELNLDPLIETLELLEFPMEYIEIVKKYRKEKLPEKTKLVVPEIISDAKQLEEFLNKLNDSITNQEYNLALTYAYSCLEGVYKAYFKIKLPEAIIPLELQKQAVIVRDDIKKKLDVTNLKYPEQILTLTATITNAVGNARNGYSVSHYDATAEKWLAEFARDCANSVARMILHFITE